jgi:hypothetical protein
VVGWRRDDSSTLTTSHWEKHRKLCLLVWELVGCWGVGEGGASVGSEDGRQWRYWNLGFLGGGYGFVVGREGEESEYDTLLWCDMVGGTGVYDPIDHGRVARVSTIEVKETMIVAVDLEGGARALEEP